MSAHGSIIKRQLASGEYVYDIKYREGGKQRMKRGLPSRRAARRELDTILGITSTIPATVGAVYKEWYEGHTLELATPTKRQYTSFANNHILPDLGERYIKSITTQELLSCVAGKREKLSATTVNHLVKILKMLFAYALDHRYITEDPAKKLRFFKQEYHEERYITIDEARRVTGAAEGRELAIILLALQEGLRVSEIFALKWEDLDFENNTLSIKRRVHRGEISQPKTPNSVRLLPLTRDVRSALANLDEIYRSGYIFRGRTGKPLDSGTWQNKHYKVVLERAGVDYIKFHGLRHSCAAHLIHTGASPAVIKRILGHASIQTTMDIYGHLFLDTMVDSIRGLDELYQNGSTRIR